MSEVVPVLTAPESQPEEAPEAPEEVATPVEDVTTWRKRLAGKDQALTATQKQLAAVKAEAEALSKWKAEKEQADLSEVEKLQRRISELETSEQTARAEATAVRLRAEYPLAADLLGDDLTKFDLARVAEINGRLAKEQAAESEQPEPRMDPNSPRRPIAKPPANSLEAAKQALRDVGNPFYDPDN